MYYSSSLRLPPLLPSLLVNHEGMLKAKKRAHANYEEVRLVLPQACKAAGANQDKVRIEEVRTMELTYHGIGWNVVDILRTMEWMDPHINCLFLQRNL